MSKLNELKQENFFQEYSQYLSELLGNLDFDSIKRVAHLILDKGKAGKTVYLIGNGGSASTASHFATDFVHCSVIDHKPIIRAVSLSDNISLITAIGNDKGYQYIFSNQLERIAGNGDVLIAISASGNSPNLIEAFKTAKEMGIITIAIVGFDGGQLMGMADYVIHVKTSKGEYGPVEDTHLFIDHMLSFYMGKTLRLAASK